MSQTQAIGGGVTSRTVEAPGLGQKRGKLERSSHVNSPSERLVARETPRAFSFLSIQRLSKRNPCRGSGERTWSGGLRAKSSPESSKPPAGCTQAPCSSRLRRGAPAAPCSPTLPFQALCPRLAPAPGNPAPAAPTPWLCCFPRSGTSLQLPQLICFCRNNTPARYHRQVTPSCNDTHF